MIDVSEGSEMEAQGFPAVMVFPELESKSLRTWYKNLVPSLLCVGSQ